MRDYKVVDHWYDKVNHFFPEFSEEIKKELAIRPGGLFEKLNLPPPKNEPAGIINGDFLKFLQ